MRIRDVGEFGLIERISKLLPVSHADVVVGIGDDVAVLETATTEYLLATCDVQVENIHFVLSRITPYQLGRRLAAINVSDIAAMGGMPKWALVSLLLPPEKEIYFVEEFYRGMSEQLSAAGAAIVGGNTSRSTGETIVDLFLIGRVAPQNLLLRDGARDGDLILVTGDLGDSRAGLELLNDPSIKVDAASRQRLEEKHLTPTPRLKEGQSLSRSGKIRAMIDISDGLLSDLEHLCRASNVGAEIWRSHIPVSEACRKVAGAAGKDVFDWALTGGEDYELLFTTAPEFADGIRNLLRREANTDCCIIGRILGAHEGVLILADKESGRIVQAAGKGWDHFSKA